MESFIGTNMLIMVLAGAAPNWQCLDYGVFINETNTKNDTTAENCKLLDKCENLIFDENLTSLNTEVSVLYLQLNCVAD